MKKQKSPFLKSSLTKIITSLTTKIIYSTSYKDRSRKTTTDFTRKRKMVFEEVVIFMIMSLKCSTQSALRRFFTTLGKCINMKQQSFSEARAKINVSAFIELFKLTVAVLAEGRCKFWHGYRLFAIDGSKIALPSDKKLLAYYGSTGSGGYSPTAQGSILYDVLNDIVFDARIEPLSIDERTLATAHINDCKDMVSNEKKLVVCDRGYPSFDFIKMLEINGFHYVMRVKTKFNKDIDAQAQPDGYVWLEKGDERIRVRVVKFKLDSGEIETLITNIQDKRLGIKAFKKLYFLRWPVETKYDVVKNKLHIENFSARTIEGVQQDFYAVMYLTNVASAAAYDAQQEIEAVRADKNNKYQYHANINELIGVLKDRFVLALANDNQDLQADIIRAIIQEIEGYVVPIRPDRDVPRYLTSRKAKFHHNIKANC